jgi:hypothetical protein
VTRQLPIVFGQTDYLQQLGTQGDSIHDVGCYLTTFANLARACGKETDPIQLNNAFIEHNLYSEGKYLTDDALTKIFPDIVYQTHYDFPNDPPTPADLNLLKELMKDPTTWVILKIDVPGITADHFVLCAGVNGVVRIADPMTKQIDDFATRYGDPAQGILKFVVYKGNPATAAVGEDYEKLYNEKRVECDVNWNAFSEVSSYLGVTPNPEDKEGTVKLAKEKIDGYINDAKQYKILADDNFKKYDEEHAKNIDLNEANKKISGENQDSSTKAYDAEHIAKDRGDFLHMIADEAGVQYDPADDKKLVDEVLQKIALARNQQNQTPEIQLLQEVANLFVNAGINKYNETQGIALIDPARVDSGLVEKIKPFWNELVNTVINQPTDTVASPIKESLKPKKNFFVSLILFILRPITVQ